MQARDLVAVLADGRAVPGNALAQRFGVSRAAVWKRIEELRAAGLSINARAGVGYQLASPIQLLDAQGLRAQLAPQVAARLGEIGVYWSIDSTSSQLLRTSTQAPDLSLCLAEMQTGGRGRRGRQWISPPGGNVYLSVLKRFDIAMAQLSGLSLVVGIALAEALDDCGAHGHGLKWPNDVLAGGAKLAGILVELGGEFLGPCHAVIGIGINLHLSNPVRGGIEQAATDLHAVCAVAPTRHCVIARVLERLVDALDRFARHGFAPFQADYAKRDLLRDQPLSLSDARGTHSGVGAGVDARGALCLAQSSGVVVFDSADVTVRAQ